ncbi:oligosaccharide flippase family protein [Glaesserella sp.]|uniref:oligosaccharide flippase family protein n=1 Tax=Glaesserella sp. TaxID=2094731 RepID=UPI00359FA259
MLKLISTVFVRQIFVGLLQVTTLVIIARHLGNEGMGQYTLAILIPSMLSQVITFGIQNANILGLGRKMINRNQAFYINLLFLFFVSIIASVLSLLFLYFWGEFFFKDIPLELFYISIASLLPLTFFAVLPSLLQAIQKFNLFNLTCIAQPVIMFIVVMVAILIGVTVNSIVYAFIIANWLVLFVVLAILFKEFKVENYSIKEFIHKFLGHSFRAHLSNIVTLLNYRASLFVLGYFTSPALVGVYTVGLQLVEKLWLPSQAVSTILLPRLSKQLGDGEDESVTAYRTLDIARYTFIVTILIGIAFIICLPKILEWFFGVEYLNSFYIALYLLPGILAWTPSRVLANDLIVRGFAHLNLSNSYWIFSINFILNLLFIPLWGIYGAAIATSIAYTFDLILRAHAFSKVTKTNAFKMLVPQKDDFIKVLKLKKGFADVK